MNRRFSVFHIMIIITLFGISSCATTTLKSVWIDETYTEPVDNVLVIGIARREVVKRFYEDEFVRQFNAHGVDALPSYRVLPSQDQLDKEDITEKVRELDIDTVLITRLIDTKTVRRYYPGGTQYYPRGPYGGSPTYRNWYGYWQSSYSYVRTPGYEVENQIISLETNLYDTQTENLIWSTLSETFVEGSSNKLIQSFIKIMMDNMAESNLVSKKQ